MLVCISCFLIPSIVNYSVIKKECTDIVSTALNCSYNSFGDYSQLPEKYKNSVSECSFAKETTFFSTFNIIVSFSSCINTRISVGLPN